MEIRIEAPGKEMIDHENDPLNWMTPVVLEEGWLDKMDSSLTSVEDSLFPELSWSDASESYFSSTNEETAMSLEETPPAKKYTLEPDAKPTSKKSRSNIRRQLDASNKHGPLVLLANVNAEPYPINDNVTEVDPTRMQHSKTNTTHPTPISDMFRATKRSWGGWSWDDQCVFYFAMKSKWTSPAHLTKRWDQIVRKLPHKKIESIQNFYIAVVNHVHDLLVLVHVDLNLNSPDEIRLALSCWHRVCSSELDISNPLHKKRLAGRLKNTLMKSRKSSEAAMSSKRNTFQQPAVIHTPVVRKKRPLQVSEAVSTTPDVPKRLCVSPTSAEIKKKQIKVRFVPIDKNTQQLVNRIGARPKVELKMNGSKRISDVCTHMMTKWAAIQPLLAENATFRVIPLGDRLHPGWGTGDISVTCWDILKQCTMMSSDEDTVTLEYRWVVAPVLLSTPTRASSLAQENTTFVNLDFLPPPQDETLIIPPPPLEMRHSITDFNGFLDEGPGACTAWMESLIPPPIDEVSVPHIIESKPKKRITPTLIS